MVVGVFKTGLERVVVDVGDRALGAHALHAHRLEFQVGHRAGRILRQGLVDAQTDLMPRLHLSGEEGLFYNLFR